MNLDLIHLALLAALFLIPKVLQRYRIPGAITCFVLGVGTAFFGLLEEMSAVNLLATFGIVSLFLLAGMEVEWGALRKEATVVGTHVAVRALAMAVTAWVLAVGLDLDVRAALLVSLGLLTPSTGFILSSLRSFGLSPDEEFWVRSKAIASELLALAMLFFLMQSTSPQRLVGASVAMGAALFALPVIFRFFAKRVVPFAHGSEFSFLIVLAMITAELTHMLGAYYLVGAFIVGVAAENFREELPTISSRRMQFAIEAFASVFTPFYFFKAGAHLDLASFGPMSIVYGLAFLILVIPLRLTIVVGQRHLALREAIQASMRIATPLLPTLVFTLVIAETVSEGFGVSPDIVGGLIVYTVVNTALPAILLRRPAPNFESPAITPESDDLGLVGSASGHGELPIETAPPREPT